VVGGEGVRTLDDIAAATGFLRTGPFLNRPLFPTPRAASNPAASLAIALLLVRAVEIVPEGA